MFFDVDKLEPKQMEHLAKGVEMRVAYGERIMMAYVNVEPNTSLAEHSHPHEQMGLLLEGEAEFTIGDEKRIVKPGMAYLIPSNVKHKVVTFDKPVLALDIFSPLREEYK
jgi:quercetin dioxygenase-like cupin family protein